MRYTQSINAVYNNVLMRVALTVTTCYEEVNIEWVNRLKYIYSSLLRCKGFLATKGTACRDRPTLNCTVETFIAFRKIDNLKRCFTDERKRISARVLRENCHVKWRSVFPVPYAKEFRRNYKLHLNRCVTEHASL